LIERDSKKRVDEKDSKEAKRDEKEKKKTLDFWGERQAFNSCCIVYALLEKTKAIKLE